MSSPAIDKYYTSVQKIKDWGGSHKETAIRQAFIALLNHYAEKKDLFLITELAVEGKHGKKVMPDGTLKNALRLDYGYWESKDEADVIDDEIEKKFKKGYPDRNILFEDSQTAVLIQEGREVMRVAFKDADKLDSILNAFVNHKHPEARKFEEALEHFKADLPTILETLRDRIETARKGNPKFIEAAEKFWTLTKHEINPDITEADIREMMIQHILTADIFNKIFDEPDFHQHNNIASELEALVGTLLTYSERKNLLGLLERYYEAINAAAASIKDHHEKQQFLKVLYENFYKVYNPKMADRLGVVYTPNEIVRFMIRSTDQLLHRHFGKTLSSRNVEILDPATGTGTFLTDLIDHLPKQDLDYKYKNEIHANEVAILPYYVANLNIEYTFKQKMGYYAEFPNLCFVDTLDNTGALRYSGKQEDMFGLSSENAARIKRQNSKKISVIIGNPPYNANQKNENENNKNRAYPKIDKRIKETFVKHSRAQKTRSYDMYLRFYSWAMGRIENNGIIALITSRSFISKDSSDGFRKVIRDEFAHAYIIDTHSDLGDTKVQGYAGSTHNVFGIKLGVAVMFLVRKEGDEGPCRIHYMELEDEWLKAAKLDWFGAQDQLLSLPFREIIPDKYNNWLELAEERKEDAELLTLASKAGKAGNDKKVLFKLFSLGVASNRDPWCYDFNKSHLLNKVNAFVKTYNSEVDRWKRESNSKTKTNDFVNREIKWTSELETSMTKGHRLAVDREHVVPSMFRPFVKQEFYFDNIITHRPYKNEPIFGLKNEHPNIVISIKGSGMAGPFHVLASKYLPHLQLTPNGQTIPIFRYDAAGTRHDNLSDWGLAQFNTHYADKKIKKEDVFHYVYAVLHDPVYREKYALNLKREFPRIPFYGDFWMWSKWGKQLMDLHIGYETVKPWPLEVITSGTKAEAKRTKKSLLDSLAEPEALYDRTYKVKVKLKADKEAGLIELDELTVLKGVPKKAWGYRLGNRSALEWILDQYKEKRPKDVTIAAKFNSYRFADHKDQVIDLLRRVCTVSMETMEVVSEMQELEKRVQTLAHLKSRAVVQRPRRNIVIQLRHITYRYEPITVDELPDFYDTHYAKAYPGELYPMEKYAQAMVRNPDIAFKVIRTDSTGHHDRGLVGFFDIIPLRTSGRQAIDTGASKQGKRSLEPNDMSADAESSTDFYIGGIAAIGDDTCSRAVIMDAFLRELSKQRAGREVTLYARPVSKAGEFLVSKFHFEKLAPSAKASDSYWRREVPVNDPQFAPRKGRS